MRSIPKSFRKVLRVVAGLAPFLRNPAIRMILGMTLMLTLTATNAGCILGPPVEPVPEEEQYPPQIALDQVTPAPSGLISVERPELCKIMQFKLGKVIDGNIGDVLYVRWFLDWAGPASMDGSIIDRFIPTGDSIERTSTRLEYNLELNELLDDGQIHAMTVVVADRALLDTVGIGFAPTTDGSTGQYDLFQWNFKLQSGGACTTLR